ncbi:MAG TPA: TetR/AcrR family transcriptional regulator [Actinophytocola sp.]|uniref:TetR/AcrR family transcriptional regulator n=1 Tax=Actinophytocola sp. TaxID=1872138 RepID=UPI002F947DB4
MPKKIDHQTRRLELTEALWRITRREGWDAISLRKVAAEAGVSMGMVQHYFTTKDEMLAFAIEMISEDARMRIRARIAKLPQPVPPRRLVWTVLSEMLPRPSRRATEVEAADVFVRRFMLSPRSAARFRADGAELRTAVRDQILLARKGSEADADRDAGGLIALFNGLMFEFVAGDQTSETALATLRAQIEFVFGPAEPGELD